MELFCFFFIYFQGFLADKFDWCTLFSVNVEISANEKLKMKDVEVIMQYIQCKCKNYVLIW